MAVRLPVPGSDENQWGELLNNFLNVEHNTDGSLRKATDISTALTLSQSAYQRPASGIPQSDLAAGAVADINVSSVSSGKITGLAPVAIQGSYASLSGTRNHSKVIHGSNTAVVRPNADYVLWEGSVEPTNWLNGDDWNEVA